MWRKVGLAGADFYLANRADFDVRRVARARAGTRRRAELVPPGICGAVQWYFAWELVKVRSQKLEGNAFRKTELADLTKI